MDTRLLTKSSLRVATRATTVDVLDKSTPPVLRVDDGDIVLVDCVDGYGGAVKSPEDNEANLNWETINPCTGPIYVEGAEPGDVLAIDILSIDVGDEGYAVTFHDCGLLADVMDGHHTTVGSVRGGRVHLPYTPEVSIPIQPLIGTFGVAPAGAPVTTLLAGDHGGNMDLNMVTAGSTVLFPVFVPGALFALGDAKAVMGDGEFAAQSLEVDIMATLRPRVLKGQSIKRPMIETADSICVVATGSDVTQATRQAALDLIEVFTRKLGLSRLEAYHLTGIAGSARAGNIVTDIVTMSIVVSKSVFHGGISLP